MLWLFFLCIFAKIYHFVQKRIVTLTLLHYRFIHLFFIPTCSYAKGQRSADSAHGHGHPGQAASSLEKLPFTPKKKKKKLNFLNGLTWVFFWRFGWSGRTRRQPTQRRGLQFSHMFVARCGSLSVWGSPGLSQHKIIYIYWSFYILYFGVWGAFLKVSALKLCNFERVH